MTSLNKSIFLLVFVVFLVGCGGPFPPTPIGRDVAPDPTGFPGTGRDCAPVPTGLPEYATLIEINPDMYQIATPLVPSFIIWDGHLTSCLGQDYVVLDIQNMGPWAFQYGWIHVMSNTQSFSTGWDDTPFDGNGAECPVGEGTTSLSPGESSHLYIPVEYTFGVTTKFDMHVTLCSFIGNDTIPSFPDHSNHCPYREYSIELLTYSLVFIEVNTEALCLTGPDPLKYEVISSMFPGDVVELLGVAKVPGWFAVRNNLYNVPCFIPEDSINMRVSIRDITDDVIEYGELLDQSCPDGETYDVDVSGCVTKCANYTNKSACEKAGCTWELAGGTSNYSTCKE